MSLLRRIEEGGSGRSYKQRLLGKLLTAIVNDDGLRPQVDELLQQEINDDTNAERRQQVSQAVAEKSLRYFFDGDFVGVPQRRVTRPVEPPQWNDLNMTDLAMRLQNRLIAEIDNVAIDYGDRAQMQAAFRDLFEEILREENILLTRTERERTFETITAEILGFGPLEVALRDETVTEVMVVTGGRVLVRRGSSPFEPIDRAFENGDHVRRIIDRIVAPLGKKVDPDRFVTAKLPDGSLVHITDQGYGTDPVMHIRKRRLNHLTLAERVEQGTLTRAASTLLQLAVDAGLSLLITGDGDTGKIDFMNTLANLIPDEAVIMVATNATEMHLQQPNAMVFQSREANVDGYGAITLAQVVTHTLHMQPDVLLVEEINGAEAYPLLAGPVGAWWGTVTCFEAEDALPLLVALATAHPDHNAALLATGTLRGLPHLVVHVAGRPGQVHGIYAVMPGAAITLAPLMTSSSAGMLEPAAPPPDEARLWRYLVGGQRTLFKQVLEP